MHFPLSNGIVRVRNLTVSTYVLCSIHALYCFTTNPRLYNKSTRWHRATRAYTPVPSDDHTATIMSGNVQGIDFGAFYEARATRAARLTAATQLSLRKPRRETWAQFWRDGHVTITRPVTIPTKQTKRDEKTDSKLFEPDSEVRPTQSSSSQAQDTLLLSALPATVRAEIYAGAFARNEPVDFLHYFGTLDFEFDLRTEDGLSEFTFWTNALGPHAWSVRSLTLKHWTSWWGFGDNTWTSSEDTTHFSRGTSGELIVSRALPTPTQETCRCSLENLLAQQDATFHLARFRSITGMLDFVNSLRAGDKEEDRPTLIDAAKTFSELLQEHSKLLSKYYGLAGSQCAKCNMPSLYLCGHMSTRDGKDEPEVVFDAKSASRTDRTSVVLSAPQCVMDNEE